MTASALYLHSSGAERHSDDNLIVMEGHFRLLLDFSLDAVVLCSAEGTILEANAEACRVFGRTVSEMRRSHRDALLDHSDPRVSAAIATRERGGRFCGAVTMRRRDGTVFEAELSTTLFRDASGGTRGALFVRDMSERRRTEKALLASEHRYRALVETTANVIVGITPDGTIFEWNREAERAYGFARREVLGRNYLELFVAQVQRAAVHAEMSRVLAGESLQHVEMTVIAKDGSERILLWNVTRQLDVAGRPLGIIASGQDVTARRRSEKERKQLETQMLHAQKLESLGVLAGGIAHDFNNLLVGILGNASMALTDLEPATPLHDMVHDIETTALRAAELTKQMLAYSGRGRFVVRPLDLSLLVEEMAHLLHTVITKRAALAFDFQRELPTVDADATQIRQIVMNLITNASDAVGERNGTITLRTGVERCDRDALRSAFVHDQLEPGMYAFVEVEDDGEGMSPETLTRIFDPFFSTKFTGRGLGLAATLGIVRGHRGTIRVESTPGAGTVFRILLPCRESQPAPAESVEAATESMYGSGTLLVVDDDPVVRSVAKNMLERRGFDVVLACNGREGVDVYRAERHRIAAVFLDLTMPQMGGEEAFREMRRLNPEVRAVLMSGYSDHELASQFADEGLSGFVQKPFRVDEIDRCLRRVLEAD